MDEFEKSLRQIRLNEVSSQSEKENEKTALDEKRRLIEEQEKRHLPNRAFLAHTIFKKDIEPVLKIIEETYLSGRLNFHANVSSFTGSFEEWSAQWEKTTNRQDSWPRYSFGWQCEEGNKDGWHDMLFTSYDTHITISVAGNYYFDVVRFRDPDWTSLLKGKIVDFLKDPEKTHNNVLPNYGNEDGH